MKFTWIVAAIVPVLGAGRLSHPGERRQGEGSGLRWSNVRRPTQPKTYACFVRRYDASHLTQHPKQKVSAMKLLVTAEEASEDKTVNYSFRLGFKYRHRAGNFEPSGFGSHTVAENSGGEIRFGCGVDCEGGGIEVAMNDDRSALIRLERIRIWERNKADDDASNDLVGGADDKVFRVDLHECSELVTDRKELAALRRK